jgi:hypothetical protein
VLADVSEENSARRFVRDVCIKLPDYTVLTLKQSKFLPALKRLALQVSLLGSLLNDAGNSL